MAPAGQEIYNGTSAHQGLVAAILLDAYQEQHEQSNTCLQLWHAHHANFAWGISVSV